MGRLAKGSTLINLRPVDVSRGGVTSLLVGGLLLCVLRARSASGRPRDSWCPDSVLSKSWLVNSEFHGIVDCPQNANPIADVSWGLLTQPRGAVERAATLICQTLLLLLPELMKD
jgi:hypothetical protein